MSKKKEKSIKVALRIPKNAAEIVAANKKRLQNETLYTKIHASEKAAEGHIKKIKARGGKVSKRVDGKKIHLKYWF